MKSLSSTLLYSWLEEVKDPEIPVLSLVDLGVITQVSIDRDCVAITLTPTFVGCPALEIMKQEIVEVLHKHGVAHVDITISYSEPWTSERITEKGKQALKKFGLAPPPSKTLFIDLDILDHVPCPRCDSTNTELKNTFGPTLCRSIHYCHSCHEAFEQFKPL
jgi:ring-1,2-phenylacetyl-CoA epoxidase subunit PaaD